MDSSCDASMFRSMSVPLDTSQYQQNAAAAIGLTNVEDQIEQIRSILKPLYYAQVSDFDTAETRALTRRLVALSKLRALGSDDLRKRFGDAFCAADLPGVFQHIWSIRDQLQSAQNGSANRSAHDKLDNDANNFTNSRSVLEDDTRPFSLVYKDLITCMWNVTDISAEMCRLVFERGCIESFINDLRTPLFLEKGMNDDLKSAVGYATRGYFGIVRNLVRGEPNCVARFVEAGGIEMSVPYLDTPFQLLKMKVIMLLSDVVTDERDETRSAIIGSRSNLEYVAKVVLDACSSGSEHDGFYSRKYAYCVDELLGAVAKLATSNDRNVQTFLETDLLDTLEQLLARLRAVLLDCAAQTDTDSAERRKLLHTCCQVLHAAFSCLWAFAFNDSAKETILRRRTIVDVLRACTPQSSAPTQLRAVRAAPSSNVHQLLNSKVHNEAAGALWQLQRCSSTHCLSEGRVAHEHSAAVEEPPAGAHVMITYQHGSQDLVRPLYEALTRVGLRVWIDYAEMHGSTVEAMALAVERAEVLLVCVSHAYKQSPSCRAEAMYAYRLKKPFIPIRVQASYVPDGWLGFICGSELLLELSKPTYLDGTLQRLVRILWQRGFSQGLPFPVPTTPEPGQSMTRYVSSHMHTHSQPNSDAASYFTQINTTVFSTDPPRIAVGPALPSDPNSYQTEKSTTYSHAASMTMSPSPSLSYRSPATQHQFSAPPSTSPYSRSAQTTRSAQVTPVARQPMHIDHVFVPPESTPGTANGFTPAFGNNGGMYGVSRSTTQYGMSNATSSYSMAETGTGAASSVTGQSSYAVSNNNNASGHVNANELTYDLVVGSPRDAKHADSAYSKRDSIELAKLAIHAESAEPARRGSTFQNVDLCELVTWSSDNVADWLESYGVGEEFRMQLRELDGSLLFELAIMQKEAPQFLYEALRTDFQLPLIALLRVVRALRKLNSPSNLLNHY